MDCSIVPNKNSFFYGVPALGDFSIIHDIGRRRAVRFNLFIASLFEFASLRFGESKIKRISASIPHALNRLFDDSIVLLFYCSIVRVCLKVVRHCH
jgi:hypothetical protein